MQSEDMTQETAQVFAHAWESADSERRAIFSLVFGAIKRGDEVLYERLIKHAKAPRIETEQDLEGGDMEIFTSIGRVCGKPEAANWGHLYYKCLERRDVEGMARLEALMRRRVAS